MAQDRADFYAELTKPAPPPVEMRLDFERAALVVIDPQVDCLSPVTWGGVGESVVDHEMVANIGRLFEAAKRTGIPVAVSPHYYFPHDHDWMAAAGAKHTHKPGIFDRRPPAHDGFAHPGAEWMPEYEAHIEDGRTIICSPHKVFGPQANDFVLQLRKRRRDQVVLAGLSAHLCVDAHLRDLIENGFEVAVVRDATAGATVPERGGFLSARVNYRWLANALCTTDEAVTEFARTAGAWAAQPAAIASRR